MCYHYLMSTGMLLFHFIFFGGAIWHPACCKAPGFWPSTVQPTAKQVPKISLAVPLNSWRWMDGFYPKKGGRKHTKLRVYGDFIGIYEVFMWSYEV